MVDIYENVLEQRGTVECTKQTSAGTVLTVNKMKKSKTSTVSVRPSRTSSRIFSNARQKKSAKSISFEKEVLCDSLTLILLMCKIW